MTENEFRFKHSQLIEYYQLIEFKLKAFCSNLAADDERGSFERLDDYSNDPLRALTDKAKLLQTQTNEEWITSTDFNNLDEIRKTRNYWCHQCFMDIKDWMPVTFKNGEVRRDIHVARIESDLLDAISMDERLAEINRGLPEKPAFGKEMQNKIDEEPYFVVTGIDFHPFNNNEKDS